MIDQMRLSLDTVLYPSVPLSQQLPCLLAALIDIIYVCGGNEWGDERIKPSQEG